jgi:hypothetical protein
VKRIDSSGGKPVWVNGVRCEGFQEAAKRLSLLAGRTASAAWVCRMTRMCGSFYIQGVTVSSNAPDPAAEEQTNPIEIGLAPLLRYPFGETTLDRGLGRGYS